MSAFRLQTFAPASDLARGGELDRRAQAARDEAYRTGFLAGQSAATESYFEDQARLTSDFVEAIHDARLTNEAARAHVAGTLAPLVGALCRAIAPALAEASLADEITRLVARALQAAPDARPRLRCAPERTQRLTELLAARSIDAAVEEAPELLPREAQIFWDQGYDHVDLDACIAQIAACLTSHLQPNSESDGHDARQYG